MQRYYGRQNRSTGSLIDNCAEKTRQELVPALLQSSAAGSLLLCTAIAA